MRLTTLALAASAKVVKEGVAPRARRLFWQRPKAGSSGFPRFLGEDVEQFCRALVKKAGVLLLPGTVYDDAGNHFRIGFGRKNLPGAIARLEEFLGHR